MDANLEYTASDYLAAFRRRRGVLLAVAIPIIVAAVALSVLLPDRFMSYAQFDLNLEGATARTLEPIEVTTYADQYIAKLQGRALSKENLRALADDPDALPPGADGTSASERMDRITGSIEVLVLTQKVTSPNTGREVDLISGFQVSSVDADPEFAFSVASYVSNLFLDADRLSRTERASSASLFLSEQMDITEKEIVGLEQEIADFKVANACCLPELVNLNMSVIERAERDITDIRPRIRTLEQDRIFLQTQLEEIRQLSATTDALAEMEQEYMTLVANYGPDHPDVTRLRRQINAIASAGMDGSDAAEIVELRMKLIEAEQKYSSEHPDVIRYKQQLAALEAKNGMSDGVERAKLLDNPRYIQVRAELNSIDTELAELRTSEPALREKIRDYESRLRRTPQVESEFQALDRKLQSARDNFDDLQRRAVIARQSEALESTDIGARLSQVVAAFVPRSPSGPPRTAIQILGVFLAATLGVGSMLFVEMTDTTVRGSKDIVRVLNMVPLAAIPVIENSTSREMHRRRLYLIRGAMLVAIAALILFYFRELF